MQISHISAVAILCLSMNVCAHSVRKERSIKGSIKNFISNAIGFDQKKDFSKENIENLINCVVSIVVTDKVLETETNPSKKDDSDGSGFIIDEDGTILTNCHVIDSADKIEVVLHDGTKHIAKVIGKDERSDIALLKIDVNEKMSYVAQFADSDVAYVLDPVFAIGSPFGFTKTVTSGIISCKNRNLSAQITELGTGGDLIDYIQTDVAINHGNSGGPLFTYDGKVVGMITVFISDNMHSTGINFAIPANTIKKIVKELKTYGKVKRSWTGITLRPLAREVLIVLGLEKNLGCEIVKLEKNSPASEAGVLIDDIFLSIDNKNILASTNIEDMLCSLEVGKIVPIQVMRGGVEIWLNLKVGYREENKKSSSASGGIGDITKKDIIFEKLAAINIGIADLTDEYRRCFNISKDVNGVLVANVENESSELSIGNLVVRVNHKKVSTVAEVKYELDELMKCGADKVVLVAHNPNKEPQQFYVVYKIVGQRATQDSSNNSLQAKTIDKPAKSGSEPPSLSQPLLQPLTTKKPTVKIKIGG